VLVEILRLSAEERARLVHELIRTLDPDAESGTTDAWDAEIARRVAEVDAGIVLRALAHTSRRPDYWSRRSFATR